MFRFTIRELLGVTAIAAIAVWMVMLLNRLQIPLWVSIPTGGVFVVAVIGMVAGEYVGGLMGARIGGGLGLLLMFAHAFLVWGWFLHFFPFAW